ncbi:glycoside hydrolase [Auricularia subglabra TFB-10046 SS5]|nr:glycoside hydrolase [Auricularia subglabra TFB-10046 SS5]
MRAAALGVALGAVSAWASLEPTRTQPAAAALDKRHNNFVAIKDGKFTLGGNPFFHLSTTAYWLAQLSDDDITATLKTINDTGFKVVRTWAFNDVTEIPPNNGTYFQLLANGTATINEGPTGLQRLDKVVTEAEKIGLKLHLTLTNNWSALKNLESASLDFPNGFLSNNYGGMDAYVRNFISPDAEHDHFFTNDSLITIFENYVTTVVKRYASSPAVFAWEIANDPRCISTQPTTPGCMPQNITRWVDRVSRTVKAADPFHLVASGAGGFMCVGCPKLFATPRPAPSPSATVQKRGTGVLLSPAKLLSKRTALLKKWREDAKTAPGVAKRTIRGRWAAPETRRQLSPSSQGTAFNGAQGVDTEDINAIQNIDFSTFQLFPDQNQYMGVDAPDVDPVTQAIDSGVAWIQANGEAAVSAGKPSALTAFGLVSQNSSQHFVPFNHSSVTVADVLSNVVKIIGANDTQQADAYRRWIQAAMDNGVGGIGQYQHGQTFEGSTSPIVTQSPLTDIDGVPNSTQTSPDDGYAAFSDTLATIFQQASQQQTALNGGGGST